MSFNDYTPAISNSDAFRLIGHETTFKRDRLAVSTKTRDYYDWRKGEPCRVAGYLDRGEPEALLMVFYGPDGSDIEEMALSEASRLIVLPERLQS